MKEQKNRCARWQFCGFMGTAIRQVGALLDMKRKRLQIFYAGRVQGVGFRYTVKSVASGFELTGRVRNLPDGRVELVCEGAQNELEAFRKAIRESGLEHFIQNEDVSWAEAMNNFRGFEIVS